MSDRVTLDEASDGTLREVRFLAAAVGVVGSIFVVGGVLGLTVYPVAARSRLGDGEGLLIALFALGFGLLLLLASAATKLWANSRG